MSLYPRVSSGKDLGRWRAGSFLPDKVIEPQVGKTLDIRDVDTVLLGPTMMRDERGNPLAVYLPGVLKKVIRDTGVYDILHPLKSRMTNNRGMASGTKRFRRGGEDNEGARSDSLPVASMIIGSIDPGGVYGYCRTTEWTGANMPEWEKLTPFFQVISGQFAEHVPDLFSAQMEYVRKTDPAWIVPGTPFTTITVNNSYSTGVHKDVGDLDVGFSCLAVLRRGEYEGGLLTFPRYRVGVDMQDGDLLLMNAHQWHGNTRMMCACGEQIVNKPCEVCGAERISVVCYYRTKMAECGSPEQEYEKALENTEKRSQPRKKAEPEPAAPEPEPAAQPDPAPEAPWAEAMPPAMLSVQGPVPFSALPEPVTEPAKPARKRAPRKPAAPKAEEPAPAVKTSASVRRRKAAMSTVKTGGADDGQTADGNDAAGLGHAPGAPDGVPSWEDS